MRFSIIIPVYNTAQYLGQCLDSIISQSYSDFEIICINDGSTDNSQEILEEYAKEDNRIIIKTSDNKGVSAARNIGLDSASGEYIIFVDSDDWIMKDALQKINDIISSESYDIVAYSFYHYYETSGVFIQNPMPFNLTFNSGWEYYERCSSSEMFGPVWRMAISSTCIHNDQLRLNTAVSHFEDMLFTIDLCAIAGPVKIIPDALYTYRRMRDGSLMTSPPIIQCQAMVIFANDLASRYHNRNDISKSILNRTICSYYRNSLVRCPIQDRKFIKEAIDWRLFRDSSIGSIKLICVFWSLRIFPTITISTLILRNKLALKFRN